MLCAMNRPVTTLTNRYGTIAGWLILAAILFLGITPFGVNACEPTGDQWFVESFTLEEARLPEAVLIQAAALDRYGSYVHVENLSNEPLYIVPRDALQIITFLESTSISNTDQENIGGLLIEESSLDQVPGLAAYVLPSEKYPSGVVLYFSALEELDPQLVDQRNWDFSPRPSGVGIPQDDYSIIILVYGGKLYEIPFTITYRINENFSADDCSKWWSSMEATEQARYEATQAAIEETAKERRSFYGPLLIFLVVVMVLVWAISLQRTRDK